MLLTKLCILSVLVGIILLIIVIDKVEIPSSEISTISKEDINKHVKFIGTIKKVNNKGTITSLEVEDKSGKINVIAFKTKNLNLKKESTIELEGRVSIYEGEIQIYAETIKVLN
ncbi:OB-fold nucleic acid binding domain-containing protein [Candidatus Woesearchaeota archaeon]|nr:OB-fold nucleic acid binding domain-containing protein [Candidatus Woesearchaeota archaeon]